MKAMRRLALSADLLIARYRLGRAAHQSTTVLWGTVVALLPLKSERSDRKYSRRL
jgi:hypothetical protein